MTLPSVEARGGGESEGRWIPPPRPGMGSGRDVGLALAIQCPQGGGCARNHRAETSCPDARRPTSPCNSGREAQGAEQSAGCHSGVFQDQRVNAARSPARLFMAVEADQTSAAARRCQPSQFRSKSAERALDRDVWQEASGAGVGNSRRRAAEIYTRLDSRFQIEDGGGRKTNSYYQSSKRIGERRRLPRGRPVPE